MFERLDRESSRRALGVPACLALALALLVGVVPAARADIASRGRAATATFPSDSTKALTVGVPAGAQPGDVLVASLGLGSSDARSQPSIAAPDGWALVTRTDQGSVGALAVYRHVLTAGETSFTWTTSSAVGGVATVSAFSGVDAADPVDVSDGRTVGKVSTVPTPSLTTTATNTMLAASYFGYRRDGRSTTWTPPSGMTELGDATNSSGSRSGAVDAATQSSAGNTGAKSAKPSTQQDYAIAVLTALRPAQGPAQDPPPSPPSSGPAISAVQAGSLTGTAATITWLTDQPADSQVEYGATSSYGSSTTLNTVDATSHSQNLGGLTPDTLYHFRVKSRDAAGALAVSDDFTFRTAAAGAIPLIVDTDMFSDADDVGALATAYGLQLRGEAKVIAVTVNTRTSRPAVATNSWKCVAAINTFYGSGSIPIGTAMPNNGTSLNSPDFIGPCARYAPASTPVPGTAVSVLRRALAGQSDGSVVIASVGYFGNLSALLNSPPDAISPLSGRDLVAQKVKTLVSMAGGYPSRFDETNLEGDPASAQNVATFWPTKIVWSGYEVGDAVHTGQTISSTHPSTSPVRAAYEAFVRPGNWIYSYDLTAVYHAVRGDDSLLSEVGPGTNSVSSTGGNAFTRGSGNQYYLSLSSATSLDAAIEKLLDTLPTATPTDTTPPAIRSVASGSLTTSAATISWSTDEPATTQVEYGTSTAYGSTTTLDASLTTNHSQALSNLSAGAVYHYRVKSKDSAGNVATSADFTFTTTAAADPTPPAPTPSATGPNDTFDFNSLDPVAWKVTQSGSAVAAANQELEITHPAGAWTKGVLASAAYDQTGKAVQVQLKRAADDGQGGSTYGETAIFLRLDTSHYAYFFVAGGSLTAWVNKGSGESNLTSGWPRYSPTTMQWLRFRESAGTLYFEYAAGTDAPGTWTTLASTPDPFALTAVTFEMAAGTNVPATDVAKFDNVATS